MKKILLVAFLLLSPVANAQWFSWQASQWVLSGASAGSGSGDVEAVNITTSSPLSGGANCASGTCAFTLGLGTVTIAKGGTNITTYALGDILYASATDTLAKLAGNTTVTKKFLMQVGDGVNSAAPTWTATAADFPTLNQSTTGNAATATALAANPTDCSAGQYANAIAANGNLTCSQVAYSEISGTPASPVTGLTADRIVIAASATTLKDSANLVTDTAANTNPLVKFTSKQADSTPFGLKLYPGQTANAFTIWNSSDAVLLSFAADGTPSFPGAGSLSERIGVGATAAGTQGVAVGRIASAGGNFGTAVGSGSSASGLNATAAGSQAGADQTNAFAVGFYAYAAASACGAFGAYSNCLTAGTISFGGNRSGTSGKLTSAFWGQSETYTSAATFTHQATGGSGENNPGWNHLFAGGKGTGTGIGGTVGLQTAYPAASTGSSLNTLSDRVTVPSKWTILTESSATALATFTFAASTIIGADVLVTVKAYDASNNQGMTYRVRVNSVRDAAGNTQSTVGIVDDSATLPVAAGSGTLTCSFTMTEGASAAVMNANCVSSLTQTAILATFQSQTNGVVTVTQN